MTWKRPDTSHGHARHTIDPGRPWLSQFLIWLCLFLVGLSAVAGSIGLIADSFQRCRAATSLLC